MNTVKRLMGIVGIVVFTAVATVGGCGGHGGAIPNPPSDLTVAEISGGGHLTWTDNSDNEASFMIERKVAAGTFAEIITVPFDTTAHHDSGPLTAGTTYVYRVMAMPKSGGHAADLKYSNEATLMFIGP